MLKKKLVSRKWREGCQTLNNRSKRKMKKTMMILTTLMYLMSREEKTFLSSSHLCKKK